MTVPNLPGITLDTSRPIESSQARLTEPATPAAPPPRVASPVVHELKCGPRYFPRLVDGSKTFEIRRDDRGYQAGDLLVIRSFDPTVDDDCGRPDCPRNWRSERRPVLRFRVGFVAKGTMFGLALGEYAVLSLVPEPSEPSESDRDGGA